MKDLMYELARRIIRGNNDKLEESPSRLISLYFYITNYHNVQWQTAEQT